MMRKIRVNTFISLDGIMQAPGVPNEDTSGGFPFGESMTHSDWKNTIILNDNPLQQIQRLKEEQAPDLLVHGSSRLIQTLLKNNLIDDMTVWTSPLLLR